LESQKHTPWKASGQWLLWVKKRCHKARKNVNPFPITSVNQKILVNAESFVMNRINLVVISMQMCHFDLCPLNWNRKEEEKLELDDRKKYSLTSLRYVCYYESISLKDIQWGRSWHVVRRESRLWNWSTVFLSILTICWSLLAKLLLFLII